MGYLGIDPGMSGGIALVHANQKYMTEAWKMPETEKDTELLLSGIKGLISLAYIESVHSMPKQGVSSSFKFGRSYGFLRGLLIGLAIPFDEVPPQRWQKALGCLSKGDKNVTKSKAQQLFPQLKITHATADALLIAHYCMMESQTLWDSL